MVERPALRRRARPHDQAAAPQRHDLPDRLRLRRPLAARSHPRRSRPVVRARRRRSGRRLRRPAPRSAERARSRRRDQGAAVRAADHDAVPGGPRARSLGSQRDRALRPHPRLVRRVFEEFSGWFSGKTSPVHLFWHGLDLAVTRFSGASRRRRSSGRRRHAGGVLAGGDLVRLLGRRRQRPGQFLLLLHEPRAGRPSRPAAARRRLGRVRAAGHSPSSPTTHVRTARDPRETLLAFLQGAYEAGARLAGWDTSDFQSKWCPTPKQLHELQATAAYEFGRPAFAAAAAATRR